MAPYFAYQANLDPFSDKSNEGHMKKFKDKESPSNNMEIGELILWEGQFSEIEGKLSKKTMFNDGKLKLLKSFYPEKTFKVWGKEYEVHVFQKTDEEQKKGYVENKDVEAQNEINEIIERIKQNEEWFSKVNLDAKKRGVSVDEMLEISAKYVIRNRAKKASY